MSQSVCDPSLTGSSTDVNGAREREVEASAKPPWRRLKQIGFGLRAKDQGSPSLDLDQ